MSGTDETTPDGNADGNAGGGEDNRGLVFRDSPLSPRNDEHADSSVPETAPPVAEAAEAEQLPLGDDDIALPWLEGDDEEEEAEGYDAGQFVSLVMLGLLALALIVGGIWWATRNASDPELVADGSLVEAPEAPYKEKPKDAGGMTFEGTGDTSFAVSQGQSRAVRLGQEGGADAADAGKPVQPGFASVGATPSAAASAAAAKPGQGAAATAPAGAGSAGTAPATGGVGVQVGAFSTRKSAEEAWQKLSQRHSALSGVRYRIVEGKADIGTVFRLQAVSGDAEGAKALCGKLKAGGLACQVKN